MQKCRPAYWSYCMQLQHGLHALDLVKLYSAGYILGAKSL